MRNGPDARSPWRLADRLVPPLLWLGAVVLLNVASTTLFFQADLTEGRVHSLAPQSIEAVSRLREPLTIRAFFSTDLQAPFNNIERAVRDLFDSTPSTAASSSTPPSTPSATARTLRTPSCWRATT